MYAPKFRYQKRTAAFYQDNDSTNLARSRSTLRQFSRQSSRSTRGLRRKTSSLGSIPIAVAGGVRSAPPADHRRSKGITAPDAAENDGRRLDTAASLHLGQLRSRFAVRSVSVPTTPLRRDNDELPSPEGVMKTLHDRLGNKPAWWESPQTSIVDESIGSVNQAQLHSPDDGALTPISINLSEAMPCSGSPSTRGSRGSRDTLNTPGANLPSSTLMFPPIINVLAGSDDGESCTTTPRSVRSVTRSPTMAAAAAAAAAAGPALVAGVMRTGRRTGGSNMAVVAAAASAGAGAELTEQERADISTRQQGGRRRSVTFKLQHSAASSGRSSPQTQPQQPRARPTSLGLSMPSNDKPAMGRSEQVPSSSGGMFLGVDNLDSGRRSSVSSRSSSASSVYGMPPVKYEYDQTRYSRRSSTEEMPAVSQEVHGDSVFEDEAHTTTRREMHARRRSIDQTFRWHMKEFELKPTTVECFNVSYTVPESVSVPRRVWNRLKEKKGSLSSVNATASAGTAVLKNVTMKIDPGSLVAVLGPSGCGKTTLLNTIAKRYSRKTANVDGVVMFNGVRSTREWVRFNVGYVAQHDSLLPALTVKETLLYAAQLRMAKSLTKGRLMLRLWAILTELGIDHVADQQIGDGYSIRGLSGGERRRVSIAVQILSAPPILVLDEPTTGLDSFTTTQLVYTLTKLTQQQHVVIMSIHQPRSDLFKVFHDIVLMNDGELVWAGPSEQMLLHFNRIGFSCPLDANPLQYFVKLASVNNNCSHQEELTAACVVALKEAYQDTEEYKELVEELRPLATKRARKRSLVKLGSLRPVEGPPPWRRLQILTKRAFVNTVRSSSAVFARAFQLPILAIYLFLFFTRLGSRDDQRSLQDRNGFRLETLVEISLASAVTAMNLCPPLRDLYRRESKEGLYGSFLFLLSYFLHCFPFAVISSLLWTLVVYVLIGVPLEAGAFFTYFATVLLLHCIGEVTAVLMLGVCRTIQAADSATTFWIMGSIAVASGTYRVGSTLPMWLYGITLVLPIGYAGNILKINELAGLNLTGCSDDDAVSTQPPLTNTTSAIGVHNATSALTCNGTGHCSGAASVSPALPTVVVATAAATADPLSQCFSTGDAYLADNLKPWQQQLDNNFAIFVSILLVFYVLTFVVFGLRRRLSQS
ncbi:uncharacterized protein LOC135809290 [Sycon ciliatum]|uniref:uncharacterized protein LOC135809290 n=1 Tax=Sycon ciliatum TaxID=27933 RepID=UPI0031F649B2